MKWTVWTAGALAVLLLTVASLHPKSEVSFRNLREAKQRFTQAGYHCTADSVTGGLSMGFLISRESVSWQQVSSLCKVGPMSTQWKGKVWVTISPQSWQLSKIPDDAESREWGEVIAYGDQDLLSEIDGILHL